jgi:hypothetical protein
MNVHCTFIENSQKQETTQMFTDQWMNKEIIVHLLWFESAMSPKDPCVKGWVPRLTLLGGCRNFKRWGQVGYFRWLWVCCQGGWFPDLFLLFFFYFARGHEVTGLPPTHAPAMRYHHSSKAMWPIWHGLRFPKL